MEKMIIEPNHRQNLIFNENRTEKMAYNHFKECTKNCIWLQLISSNIMGKWNFILPLFLNFIIRFAE